MLYVAYSDFLHETTELYCCTHHNVLNVEITEMITVDIIQQMSTQRCFPGGSAQKIFLMY